MAVGHPASSGRLGLTSPLAPDRPAGHRRRRTTRSSGCATAVHAVHGAEAMVGGPTAENLDTEVTTSRDEKLVIPLVLASSC